MSHIYSKSDEEYLADVIDIKDDTLVFTNLIDGKVTKLNINNIKKIE